MSIVSNNIKYLRRLNGLTQEQFARRIGIKRSLLGAYEEARANPNLENLKMIAQVFGTSVDALIKTDIRKIRETPGLAGSNTATNPYKQVVVETQPISVGNLISTIVPNTNQGLSYSAPPPPPATPRPEPQAVIATVVDKYFRTENQINLVSQRIVPKKYNFTEGNRDIPKPAAVGASKPITPTNTSVIATTTQGNIPMVNQNRINDYLVNCQKADFINNLPKIAMPNLRGDKHRAFETGNDFPLKKAVVIGSQITDWSIIKDGSYYILVSAQHGIIYRRVYSQAKIKGTLLLSSDNPSITSFEIALKEILEIWDCQAYLSYEMPEPQVSLERIKTMVNELKIELDRI